jgi:hypothetical protein
MNHLKALILSTLLATCCVARADCPSTLPLKGLVNVDSCNPSSGNCIPASEALYKYMEAVPDGGPEDLVIGLHGSPWHLYDADYRILEIGDLAEMVRQQGNKIKRVTLIASWSGTAPDQQSKSLAQKLSIMLKGMPVTGKNGFVWVSKNGAVHTTQQAFTARSSGPYWIKKGDKVMASLVPGWTLSLPPEPAKKPDAAALMRIGAGYDIFMLCPERALKAYDASAALSNPIAAFNAAVMRLERGAPGDAQSAVALLKQAAASGDQKAQAKLTSLSRGAPAI